MAAKKKVCQKPFVVIADDLRLQVTPDDGWLIGESLDARGLIVQSKTVEKLIRDAREVATMLEKSRTAWNKDATGVKPRRKRRTA